MCARASLSGCPFNFDEKRWILIARYERILARVAQSKALERIWVRNLGWRLPRPDRGVWGFSLWSLPVAHPARSASDLVHLPIYRVGATNRDSPIALPSCTDSLRVPCPPDSSHSSRRFGPGCRIPDALFIAVSVGAELVRVGGLRVITPVAAKLAIVLAVLHALPEVHLIVVGLSIVAALLILALLCGNRGGPAARAEPGKGDPKGQHPWGPS